MCSVESALEFCRDCRSVLRATNSTPGTWASTIRLTALTPAPPTPTTRRTAWCVRGTTEARAALGSSRPKAGPMSGTSLPIRRCRPSCSILDAGSSVTCGRWSLCASRSSISSIAGSRFGFSSSSSLSGPPRTMRRSSSGGASTIFGLGLGDVRGIRLGLGLRQHLGLLGLRAHALDLDLVLRRHLGHGDVGLPVRLGGGHLDLVAGRGLVSRAEQVRKGAFAHAGALLTSHGSGPPWPGRGSSWRRCRPGRT